MTRLLLLGLLAALPAQQEGVEVSASLDRTIAQVGETVRLTFTLSAPSDRSPEVEDPVLEGFEVLAKTDRSTFRFSTSAGALRGFSREYTLRVIEAGVLTVPPIQVTVEGVLYETDPLQLTAQSGTAINELPAGLGPRPEEEVAVRLWVEPETAFVGQQVTMTVGAFFDPLVRSRLQRQPEYRAPEVLGFWTADLPGTVRPERRVVGRREYFVQIYRRALFPLSPGTVTIPPAAVIYEVRRGLIYAPETFQVESPPATIEVRPLPEAGKPADFAGAVGRFEAEVWFDRSDLRAGEAVNLVLEVKGSGNLSSLGRPELPEVPGIRVYEGGEAAEVQLHGVEFAGHKRFSWVLVPEDDGEFVLPGLRLPYFDPVEARYRVARTDPITLQVDPPSNAAFVMTATGARAIRFVKPSLGRQAMRLAQSPAYWLAQAIPLVLLIGLLGFGRYQRRAPKRSERTRVPRRQQVLRSLRPLAETGEAAFFGDLRVALLGWLQSRLHIPDLSARGVVQVQHALEDNGVPPDVALDAIDVLERCARLRYSPDPPGVEEALDMLARAEKLLALVDQEAVSERRLRTAPSGAGPLYMLMLLFCLAWTSVALAQSAPATEPDVWFAEGLAAYERGEYAAAAGHFERALVARPDNPAILFNLGNSYHEAGERGRAVAYWVRTLRLTPRDGDARFNLALVVGDDPVIGGALPPLPVSSDELAVVFTLFWFGGCAAIVARRRRRRGYLTLGGGAALTLALFSAVLMLYPRSDYAVIAAHEAALRAGPVRQSEILASPAPGIGYRVQERRGEWLRVSRGGDSEGWVEVVQVELVD